MIKSLNHQVSDISTGRAPLQINLNWPQGSSTPTVLTSTMPSSSETSSSLVTCQPPITATAPTGSASTNVSSVPNIIQYRLSRGLTTFTDIWGEWSEGLGGNHSVECYETNCPNWYVKDKTFYMRRKRLIKIIQSYADVEGRSMREAVNRAESLRVRSRRSLDYLSKNKYKVFVWNSSYFHIFNLFKINLGYGSTATKVIYMHLRKCHLFFFYSIYPKSILYKSGLNFAFFFVCRPRGNITHIYHAVYTLIKREQNCQFRTEQLTSPR